MIQTLKVSKRFDDFQALYPTDLSVKERSFTAVLGPSGSGKTTLLRIIAGLERSDGGCVKLAGRPVDDPSAKIFIPPEKRNISMVFQDFVLWPHMTVFGNVAYGLRARG